MRIKIGEPVLFKIGKYSLNYRYEEGKLTGNSATIIISKYMCSGYAVYLLDTDTHIKYPLADLPTATSALDFVKKHFPTAEIVPANSV